MSVDPGISLTIIKSEIKDCEKDCIRYGWTISEIDDENQSFSVRMRSPIDKQEFIIEINFKNYREEPLLIEFIDLVTGERGTKKAYPRENGKLGNFFHNYPCICHPCSRKAYGGFSNVHKDWQLSGWQQNPKIDSLKTLRPILRAIYSRISDPENYQGRMG
ncbi:MAG: hypothetical protein HY776_05325 [Actinobacteria bacterium]|nr:hypothetical protein [Actinomycetota bacterium]